jgi:hypothetical protein
MGTVHSPREAQFMVGLPYRVAGEACNVVTT